MYDRVSELHPEFASLNAQEKFVYLLRYENREVAKYFEKLTTSVNTTYTNNVYFVMYCAIGNLLSLLNVMYVLI